MHALAKCGLATALVAAAVASNLILALSVLPSADAQARLPEALDWRTLLIPGFGTTVDYPAGIFSVSEGKPDKGVGERFKSADGRTELAIYSRENEEGDSPASYLRKNLRLARSKLDYERVARRFFAISSEGQGVILYSRCNFSSEAGGAIHCFDLLYPRAERRAWDAIVTRISRSLRPLEG
jgi:hypothetical protein